MERFVRWLGDLAGAFVAGAIGFLGYGEGFDAWVDGLARRSLYAEDG